jgi:hypothetical protein
VGLRAAAGGFVLASTGFFGAALGFGNTGSFEAAAGFGAVATMGFGAATACFFPLG